VLAGSGQSSDRGGVVRLVRLKGGLPIGPLENSQTGRARSTSAYSAAYCRAGSNHRPAYTALPSTTASKDAGSGRCRAGTVTAERPASTRAGQSDAGTALPVYRAAHPGGSPGDLLADVLTDWWVRVPALRLADAHAAAPAATYMYEFAWPSPVFDGRLGACHALELPFVFDTIDLGRGQMMGGALGDDPPQELADRVHGAWIAFATDGDPGWPRYDLDRRPVMRLDTTPSLMEDPYARERDLWNGVR
jgi:para-nitrobenzyl esterase